MNNTSLSKNSTTPFDIGLFFNKLWQNEIINENDRNELLSYMTNTVYEDWLSKGVPSGISVSHKYGREVGVVNDAGIVFSEPKYIAVIMSKDADLKEADMAFPSLSQILYETVVNN